ncbi:MAG: hypothetical protein AAF664_01495 [Planctomycetota bacterium]
MPTLEIGVVGFDRAMCLFVLDRAAEWSVVRGLEHRLVLITLCGGTSGDVCGGTSGNVCGGASGNV